MVYRLCINHVFCVSTPVAYFQKWSGGANKRTFYWGQHRRYSVNNEHNLRELMFYDTKYLQKNAPKIRKNAAHRWVAQLCELLLSRCLNSKANKETSISINSKTTLNSDDALLSDKKITLGLLQNPGYRRAPEVTIIMERTLDAVLLLRYDDFINWGAFFQNALIPFLAEMELKVHSNRLFTMFFNNALFRRKKRHLKWFFNGKLAETAPSQLFFSKWQKVEWVRFGKMLFNCDGYPSMYSI